MFNNHKKTSEYHKIAEKLRMAAPEPIENIRHAIIKYKLVKKYKDKSLSSNIQHLLKKWMKDTLNIKQIYM